MDDLLTDFIAETRETLEAIAGEIVAWEADPGDRARLDHIFRFVHTVKGSCGFLNLPRLERLSHAAEDALATVRSGERTADSKLVSAVLAIIDRIGDLADALESGEAVSDADDQELIGALAPDAAAAQAPIAIQTAVAPRAASRSIRVPVDLLDRMMAGVSDLVLARNELARKLRAVPTDPDVEAAFERLSATIAEQRDSVTRTRMARIDHLFAALPRLVRDLCSELGKSVALSIDGGDVELDREMIEVIRDPLTHIVRNAIDHGIEPATDRVIAGKPRQGSLRVSARQTGNQILIEIADDGRGIDGDRLVQKAVVAGLVSAEDAPTLSWSRKLALIFEPGLTTAQAVTAISGRGVGMDVVRANVEKIGGAVEIESKPGLGLRLTLRVPLTLTIIPALTVSAGGQYFAIPRATIEEIVRGQGAATRIETVAGATIAAIRGTRVPLVALRQVMGFATGEMPLLVVLKPAGGERFALAVDAVHDHEELVVKPAAPAIMASGLFAGATLPDDSRPMLLLDPAGVAAAAGVLSVDATPVDTGDTTETASEARFPALLFRDLDGVERAIRLSLVERIEDAQASEAIETGGRLRITLDGMIVPLIASAPITAAGKLRLLRLNDGTVQLAYGIQTVVDIVSMGDALEPALGPGAVVGVALIDGRQVELLDPYWLFAGAAGQGTAGRPLCILAGDSDGWMQTVLAPLIEAAGYTIGELDAAITDPPTLVLTRDTALVGEPGGPVVVHLRDHPQPAGPADTSIYRYDRAGLIGALSARAGGR
ncbi:chemotaxis protein CheW [Sphingomonas sp. 1P06PA]|uniref:chemotaxis protein CheW n=1 Tax=Sphingomonas sp. 1P06PA TaxID=554121 RepID=UPI0039A4A5AA